MVEKIKVIFLDVDGVLNSSKTTRRTIDGYTFVGSRQLKNLRQIIDTTGAKVVLSSDWRYGRDDPAWNRGYLELKMSFYDMGFISMVLRPNLHLRTEEQRSING